ncbi:MAG: lipoyl(octanoyl) transferase LipB [Propionibacteriaceae bacterium]|nr:lipoyl(octanoyl) transferase LipB [Propionibacteriaceae bacterium]
MEPDPRPVEFRYLGLGERLVDYAESDAEQRRLHALVADGLLGPQVLFVEHRPVYTQGRTTLDAERPRDHTPVVNVDRGGKITYHGPGQLVGYPIVFLPWKTGVVNYVRRVEEALIRLLAEFGLSAGRVPGRTGVWLPADAAGPERKIAAIGIRVAKQTTLHGFGLNINPDLSRFDNIIPCGIADAGVTSLERELAGTAPSLVEIARRLEPHLSELLRLAPYESVENGRG